MNWQRHFSICNQQESHGLLLILKRHHFARSCILLIADGALLDSFSILLFQRQRRDWFDHLTSFSVLQTILDPNFRDILWCLKEYCQAPKTLRKCFLNVEEIYKKNLFPIFLKVENLQLLKDKCVTRSSNSEIFLNYGRGLGKP